MSGVLALRRRWHRANVRPSNHITKAEHAEHFRRAALSLMEYADNPDAAASALEALDHAEECGVSPRAGWYPRRPARWRP